MDFLSRPLVGEFMVWEVAILGIGAAIALFALRPMLRAWHTHHDLARCANCGWVALPGHRPPACPRCHAPVGPGPAA
jgi:hypothetical protein